MAGRGAFDIYQTDAGYAAVTSPVQRQILEMLRTQDRQLPELVQETGRSKPTLSSLHMKELLSRELVEELPHPTDARRKVYRLKATRIGSSDVPVAQLRDAVRRYVSLGPMVNRLPFGAVLQILASAPATPPAAALEAQGKRLGALVGSQLAVPDLGTLWRRAGEFLEAEEAVAVARSDPERLVLEVRPGALLKRATAPLAPLLAGLLMGMASGKALPLRFVAGEGHPGGIRLTGTRVPS